jgi:hypothetical protein
MVDSSAEITSAEDSATEHLRSITGAEFDELVERVADRLEQRVVDELARRGRHRVPEVF